MTNFFLQKFAERDTLAGLFFLNKYNGSVNNTTLYFIHNKNSILSGRHVSIFIRSSSGPLGKHPRAIYISIHCGIPNAFRLCYMNVKYISL